MNSTHTVAREDLTRSKRFGFIIGFVVFGLVARWGLPSEPILQVVLKTLLWPAWLVEATIGGLSTDWLFVAFVKCVSLVSVGAFFAYLFLSYRLNAGLAMVSLVVSSAATWWFLREYWATWTASPPPGWSAFIFWPAKMVATALFDSGAGGASNQSLSASAMFSMTMGTAIVHVTIVCCVRTAFRAFMRQPAPGGESAPSPSTPD